VRQLVPTTIVMMALTACGGAQRVDSPQVSPKVDPREASPKPPSAEGDRGAAAKPGAGEAAPPAAPRAAPGPNNEFVLRTSGAAEAANAGKSKIQSTATEAALKFTVVDKDKGPVKGIVISLTDANGVKHYTEETDAEGYAEALVPIGQKYDLVFLSLGRRDVAASVNVSNEPKQNIKLTLRYKRQVFEPVPAADASAPPRFVLSGVTFDTGKATIRPESFPRLDGVVEFMTHKKRARIEIAGHTDNVGSAKTNKALSEKRALACRSYLISKGIDGERITAVGYGGERPIAPNDTEEGRQRNRRIEATEL
jgi:outer membrane protein OmpA-like peptidoglycan-associated protein